MALSKGFTIRGTARTEGVTRPMSKLEQELERARKKAGEVGKEFDLAGAASKRFGQVIDGAFERIGHHITDTLARAPAALVEFTSGMVRSGREAQELAARLGGSSQQMQALMSAGRRLRLESEDVAEGLTTLQENLGEMVRLGTGPAVDSLGSLGLKLSDFAGLDVEGRLKLFADALSSINDESVRTSIAMEVMGDDGKKMMPLLLQGASGIDALTAAAREAGQVLDEDAIAMTRELDRSVADMEAQVEGASNKIVLALLPTIQDAASGMQTWIAENDKLINQDIPAVASAIASGFGTVVNVLVEVGQAAAAANQYFIDLEKSSHNMEDRIGVNTALFGERAIVQAGRAAANNADMFQSTADPAQIAAGVALQEISANNDAMVRAAEDLATKTLADAEAASRVTRGTLFQINEIASQHQGGRRGRRQKPRDDRAAHEILGFDDPGALRDQAFVARREEARQQRELQDPFSEDNLAMQEQLAAEELDRTRRFEQAKAQIVLDERMRGIEELRAQGADPITMIDAEEQARVRFLEGQLQRTDDEIEQMRIKAQIEEEHHRASLARMAEQDQAREKQAALITAHTDAAINNLAGIAEASIGALGAGEGGVRMAVHGFARAKAIEMAILAGSETARGVAALASPITAPFAAAHFNAAAVAAVTGAGFGVLAGATFGGGVGAGAGAAGVGATNPFAASGPGIGGGGGGGGGGTSQEAPISRSGTGSAGAASALRASTDLPTRAAGRTVVVNLTQHGLGFGAKEETAAEVRRVLQRSEQEIGTI